MRPHAVKQIGSNYFCYDQNGNMTRRNSNSSCTSGDSMSYDVENRMTQMIVGATTTNLAYNGDGTRVKREVVGVGTTYYVGNHYEIYKPNGGSATFNKYYYFGTNRVAARIGGTLPNNGTLFYMQGDHLGSSSLVMTSGGALQTRQTYFPYGAKRVFDGSALPTDYTFTGQKSDDSTGLMFYNARYYDATLGRFTQADTIVPDPLDPQSWNRYAYALNNPVRYTDPTGHMVKDEDGGGGGGGGGDGGGGDGGGEPIVVTPETANQYYHPPADTGEPQYPNGKACWPRCNRDDAIETERNQDPIQVAIGSGSGAFCFTCRYRGNVQNDSFGKPHCQKGSGSALTPDGGGCGGGGNPGGGGGKGQIPQLPKDVRDTFEYGNARGYYTQSDQTWYRAHGGSSGPFGKFFGNTKPESAAHAERLYNVTKYGNNVLEVSTFNVPKGTWVWEGPVAGGTGRQIFIPDPKAAGIRILNTESLYQGGP